MPILDPIESSSAAPKVEDVPSRSAAIKIVELLGEGRPAFIIFEGKEPPPLMGPTAAKLAEAGRVYLAASLSLNDRNWSRISSEFSILLNENAIRQASFICVGAAGALAQHLCLVDPRLVRSLILLNPTSRPHPTMATKVLDFIENKLPLGLPLRSLTEGFDSKAFLHRIRCPMLILTTPDAGPFVRRESEIMARFAPTAWHIELGVEDQAQELSRLIKEFQAIPVKCPQKNLGGR